jgi:hypothetical protein
MNMLKKIKHLESSFSLLSSLMFCFLSNSFLMSSTLTDSSCDISVDLSITLCSFEIDTLLLGDLLETRSLPFWQPAFWIRLGTWILRVKVLWISHLLLSLLWHENFSTSFGFLHYVLGFLFLFLLWHTIFNQLLQVLIIIK